MARFTRLSFGGALLALSTIPAAGATPAPEAAAPILAICGLDAGELATRRAEVGALLAGALRGWSADGSTVTLRLHVDGLLPGLRLILLERRCCPGVEATLRLPAEGDVGALVIGGPPALLAELKAMLGASGLPGEAASAAAQAATPAPAPCGCSGGRSGRP